MLGLPLATPGVSKPAVVVTLAGVGLILSFVVVITAVVVIPIVVVVASVIIIPSVVVAPAVVIPPSIVVVALSCLSAPDRCVSRVGATEVLD